MKELVEDLKIANVNLYCANKMLEEEIKRLNNIIKEVRESINKKLNVKSDCVDYDFGTELLRQELLEILAKARNK